MSLTYSKPIPTSELKYFRCPDCGTVTDPSKDKFTCKIHGSWQIVFLNNDVKKTSNQKLVRLK
jgi:hypothetical protein